MPDTLETAIAAARLAGQAIRESMKAPLDIQRKGFRDVVTNADYAAQDVIVHTLLAAFPQSQIWAEERGLRPRDASQGLTWVIDPLDGTSNFSHGLPPFGTSIGLLKNGQAVAGVVYDPLHDFLFSAQRGEGAFLNGQPIHASPIDILAEAIVACDWPREGEQRARNQRLQAACLERVHTFRSFGSATIGICYVAAGWLEAYFNFSLYPWDLAAATVIVEEAGGQVTTPYGAPLDLTGGICLASNGYVHEEMVALAVSNQ